MANAASTRSFLAACLLAAPCLAQPATQPTTVPSTIFADPNYEGAADPELVWNTHTREWWIFYTARRMMAPVNPGCGGTPIGICTSSDLIHWRFVGYCKFDGVGGDKESAATYWAPGIITDDAGNYHMYVVFKPGNEGEWGGDSSVIRHYTAKPDDLLNGWTKVDDVTPPPQSIDAGLIRTPGQWWMYYRDLPKKGEHPGSLYWATSPDGQRWDLQGQMKGDPNDQKVNSASYQEAPYAFRWKDTYWLLADAGEKLNQYKSNDLKTWSFAGPLLQNPGSDPLDTNSGKHPSVAVIGGRAFIAYFNHPYRPADQSYLERRKGSRSWLHLRELELRDGKLFCDRDKPVVPPADVTPDSVNAGR